MGMDMEEENPVPTLYIIATPIGNLEDITLRAIRTLKEVDLLFSEDTRKTGILLHHFEIGTRQKSFRIHQLEQDIQVALQVLQEGKSIGLCTDAGTPGVSDPGSALVRKVRETLPQVKIVPIPGPSALATALSVCGWQTNPSAFFGFPSPKPGKRRKLVEESSSFPGISVFYESVHRIEKLIRDMRELAPDRSIFIGREMTKVFEDFILLDANIPSEEFEIRLKKLVQKGEFTVILGPPPQKKTYVNSERDR